MPELGTVEILLLAAAVFIAVNILVGLMRRYQRTLIDKVREQWEEEQERRREEERKQIQLERKRKSRERRKQERRNTDRAA